MNRQTASKIHQQKSTATPTASGLLQRKCVCGNHTMAGSECEECREKDEVRLQRAAVNSERLQSVPPIVREVLQSPGQELETETRAFFESRFGHDFGRVRVHTDGKAAASADAVSALAYTVQNHIVFGTDRYHPQSLYGRQLFAHELVHTIQQSTSGNSVLTGDQLAIREPDDASEREAEVASRTITQGQLRSTPFKAQQAAGYTIIQRVIQVPRRTWDLADGTSQEARAQIDRAREAANALAPEARRELRTRIEEAEAALGAYRATVDSSSLGMHPILASTGTGNPAAAVGAALALFGAWIIGSNASRAPANREAAERLAEALRRLAEAARHARQQPAQPEEVPPQEVPAPRPPGEVIPIETHPRFAPRAPKQSTQPETPPVTRLGPDIFPVPISEPQPRQRDRREECLKTHPYALRCEDEISMEEVVQDYIMGKGYSEESLGKCRLHDKHKPRKIDECNGAPGESWHCSVYPYVDPIAKRSLPGDVFSVFSCLCCRPDGSTSFEWRGPHPSRKKGSE